MSSNSKKSLQQIVLIKEQCKKDALLFTSRFAYQKGNRRSYNKAKYYNFLDEVCIHMSPMRRPNWTPELIIEESKKYNSYLEFSKNRSAYYAARDFKILDQIKTYFGLPLTPRSGHKAWQLERRKILMETLINKCHAHGGLYLGPNPLKDIHSKVFLSCVNGHKFSMTAKSLKSGYWCSQCSSRIFKGEEMTRVILQSALGISLPKVKSIKGMVSHKGFDLEFDGYNSESKIAFEYNGNQHYEYIPFIHHSLNNFKKQQLHDNIKKNFCEKNNIKLIIIPEYVLSNPNKFIDHVIGCVIKEKLTVKTSIQAEELLEKISQLYKSMKFAFKKLD